MMHGYSDGVIGVDVPVVVFGASTVHRVLWYSYFLPSVHTSLSWAVFLVASPAFLG